MAAKIYTTKDAPIAPLKKKTLAVIGFGSQGHAHALNLKDSGVKVIIGLYPKSKSREVAKKLGFEVFDTAEAVKKADVIFVAVPDTKIPAVYNKDIAPNLTKGKTLLFSHGFAIHFKTIVPPKDIDVILVAPKGPGHIVRRQFIEGKGVPGLIAIYQNAPARPRKPRSPGPRASAAPVPVSSKPTSRRKPRPTSSANRSSFAAAPPRSSKPDSKPSSKPDSNRKWPISSASTSSSSSST